MRQEKSKQNEERKGVSAMVEVIRLHRMENKDGSLKAYVDIKVCDAVLIKGVRVLSNKEGALFVAMPSQKAQDGKYYETVKLLTDEAKQELQEVVLSAYQS